MKVIAPPFRLAGSASMDALPANRTWQPPCSHGTYQHEAITSRSRQLLMMGTRLPETCWATIRREITNTKKRHLVGFSYPYSVSSKQYAKIRCLTLRQTLSPFSETSALSTPKRTRYAGKIICVRKMCLMLKEHCTSNGEIPHTGTVKKQQCMG